MAINLEKKKFKWKFLTTIFICKSQNRYFTHKKKLFKII